MSTVVPDDLFERLARPPLSQDPYPLFAELRATGVNCMRSGAVILARHSDVTAVLGDDTFAKPRLPALPIPSVRTLFRMFLMLDDPDHARLRRVIAPLFTPAAVARRRDDAAVLAAELLHDRTELDAIAELAYPFPLRMICRQLGAPPVDEPAIATWAATLTRALDMPQPLTPRDAARFGRAAVTRRARPIAMLAAAHSIVRYARSRLDEDPPDAAETLAAIRAARDSGSITDDEAAATWVLLVIAGHETTANLIGNTLHALLTHRDQLDAVAADRTLLAGAIDEALRLETPVPLGVRTPTRDVDLDGERVAAGTLVHVLFGAANRDDAVFARPNRYDVTRDAKGHVGFGRGGHFCLGVHLARLEAETALAAVLARRPTLVPGADARWRDTFATRGLTSLPIAFT